MVTAYICNDFEGVLKKDESEVKDYIFFHFNEIPSNISPPDLSIIQEYIQNCFFNYWVFYLQNMGARQQL